MDFALVTENRMISVTRVSFIKKHFAALKDPRVRNRTRHHLVDIIVIALCGVIANCDTWAEIVDFGNTHDAWLKQFLKLPNGIPSQDTFERVFAKIDPATFSSCCVNWLRSVSDLIGLGHVAIDGKTLCGSHSARLGPLHLVSAWATEAKLTLGEVAVEGKSNEIKAIPELLKLLDLKGTLVTIDAIGCQKEIVKQIIDKSGNYLVAVKGNQEHLLEDIQATMAKALDGELAKHAMTTITRNDEGHGRKETRIYTAVTDLDAIRDRKLWSGLTTVCMCWRECTVNGKTTEEVRYFIASGRMGARKLATATRNHWGIENNKHWQLDVSFGEDASKLKERIRARNFASMRRLALDVLKRNPAKKSIRAKRKLAAQDTAFLTEIITGAAKSEKI
jgi:predicted transposase YbfD/YdcC